MPHLPKIEEATYKQPQSHRQQTFLHFIRKKISTINIQRQSENSQINQVFRALRTLKVILTLT